MHVFIPRFMDATQLNPQNNNARMMLQRWGLRDERVTTITYWDPDPAIVANPRIRVVRLWRRHAWMLHLALSYMRRYDLVFYPGVHSADTFGLKWRRLLGRSAPVVATLEGLVGDAERERYYSAAAGHSVYCQHVDPATLDRADTVLRQAKHVIAISPFLARMGRLRYGDKFSALPLGVDIATYYPDPARAPNPAPVVVGAGRVAPHKRPALFLQLAERHPGAEFRWYGEGEQREALVQEAQARGLHNLQFPGALTPPRLAEAFRQGDLFILPSHSEGVPKVTQEAAACGLPVLVYGFYEAPSVVDGVNGFVVWDDAELFQRVDELLGSPGQRKAMAAAGVEMARAWSWEQVAPRWFAEVMRAAGS